jgi:hypothetical protein
MEEGHGQQSELPKEYTVYIAERHTPDYPGTNGDIFYHALLLDDRYLS